MRKIITIKIDCFTPIFLDRRLNKERERRLAKTGRWFESNSKVNNKDIYLTYFMPLILIISLCATIYVALS